MNLQTQTSIDPRARQRPNKAAVFACYAACAWAVLFAAPHIWWALGISAGFPGGEGKYRFFISSTWRYVFDLVVIFLCALAILVAVILLRSTQPSLTRRLAYIAAWIACGILSLRGVAGLVHDGFKDRIWNPTFLTGGILFGCVAWLAHRSAKPDAGRHGY